MMATAPGSSTFDSQSTSEYDQEEKKLCRTKLIQHAIKCLTTDRETSACVHRNHVQRVWNQIHQSGEVNLYFTKAEICNIEQEIRNWEVFHESQIQTRKPSHLRVCYLGGDNPLNDLEVLVDNGVLSQNIWAIEKNAKTFEKACQAISKSRLRNIRLFKGDILDFFQDFESQFDIIYFDACGSLPAAKQKTLKVIGYVFLYNKLTSPGSLITTFSFPPKTEEVEDVTSTQQQAVEDERVRITCLAKEYLNSRLSNTSSGSGNDLRKLSKLIGERDDEKNYSDYITYQIVDSASLFIPAQRMFLSRRNSLWDQVFISKDEFLEVTAKKVRDDTDAARPNSVPRLNKLVSDLQAKKCSLCKAWANEIFPDSIGHGLIKQPDQLPIMALTHLLSYEPDFIFKCVNSNFQKKCLNPVLESASNPRTYPSFCDEKARDSVGLVAGILYGQMAYPSFPVLDKLLRLRYTAKQRQMFSDVFIFDKCRYLYEQFPTVDCGCFAIEEQRQLVVIRMVVDGFRKHMQGICRSDLFPYCDVATEGFWDCSHRGWPIVERQVVDKKFDAFPENKVVICTKKAFCHLEFLFIIVGFTLVSILVWEFVLLLYNTI